MQILLTTCLSSELLAEFRAIDRDGGGRDDELVVRFLDDIATDLVSYLLEVLCDAVHRLVCGRVTGDVRDHDIAVVDSVFNLDNIALAVDLCDMNGCCRFVNRSVDIAAVEFDVLAATAPASGGTSPENVVHESHAPTPDGIGISLTTRVRHDRADKYRRAVIETVTTTATDSPAVSTREAVRADLLAVYRVEKASFSQPWPFRAFEQYLGRPGFLVADAGDVVGYVVADDVSNHGRRIGHVKDIAVAPSHRGRGIGATLLENALDVCRKRGIRSVKLEVRASNEPALSLYRRYGFIYRTTSAGYYADGEDAFVLVRELSG